MLKRSQALLILGFFLQMPLAVAEKAPLHPKILNAKKIYFTGRTGWQKHSDVAYTELKRWGRWELVQEQESADLILILDTKENTGMVGLISSYPSGAGAVGIPLTIPTYYLHVIDPASGQSLWIAKGHEGLLKSGIAKRLIRDLKKAIPETLSAR